MLGKLTHSSKNYRNYRISWRIGKRSVWNDQTFFFSCSNNELLKREKSVPFVAMTQKYETLKEPVSTAQDLREESSAVCRAEQSRAERDAMRESIAGLRRRRAWQGRPAETRAGGDPPKKPKGAGGGWCCLPGY